MRLVLFGDGKWATESLAALAQNGHTIAAVVLRACPSDPELEELARSHGVLVLQPTKVNDRDFANIVRSLSPDVGISIAYNQIFRPVAYNFLPKGLINFHAGKLPFYRGRNVINWAILNGEKHIGLTSHFVDEGIDTGRIILQETFPIGWTDGYGDVLARIVAAFPEFVLNTLLHLDLEGTEPQVQSGEGTYFPGRGPDDEWLNWNDTSFNLHNKVRAITRPGPGARTVLADTQVRIWRAFYDPSWPNYIATPGVVVGRSPSGVRVKTGDSVLLVQEIEMQGKEPGPPDWRPGTRLWGDFHVCRPR